VPDTRCRRSALDDGSPGHIPLDSGSVPAGYMSGWFSGGLPNPPQIRGRSRPMLQQRSQLSHKHSRVRGSDRSQRARMKSIARTRFFSARSSLSGVSTPARCRAMTTKRREAPVRARGLRTALRSSVQRTCKRRVICLKVLVMRSVTGLPGLYIATTSQVHFRNRQLNPHSAVQRSIRKIVDDSHNWSFLTSGVADDAHRISAVATVRG